MEFPTFKVLFICSTLWITSGISLSDISSWLTVSEPQSELQLVDEFLEARIKRAIQSKAKYNCKQITCNFEAGTSCLYETGGKIPRLESKRRRRRARTRRLRARLRRLRTGRRRVKRQGWPTINTRRRVSLNAFFIGAGMGNEAELRAQAAEELEFYRSITSGDNLYAALYGVAGDKKKKEALAKILRSQNDTDMVALADALDNGAEPRELVTELRNAKPKANVSAFDNITIDPLSGAINALTIANGRYPPLEFDATPAITPLSYISQIRGYLNYVRQALDLIRFYDRVGPEVFEYIAKQQLTWEVAAIRYGLPYPLNQARSRACQVCNQLINDEIVQKTEEKDRWLVERLPHACQICGQISGRVQSDALRELERSRWDEHGYTDEKLDEYEKLVEAYENPKEALRKLLEKDKEENPEKYAKPEPEVPGAVQFTMVRGSYGTGYRAFRTYDSANYVAATYLHPGDHAILEVKVRLRRKTYIEFDAFKDGSRSRLKMCCDAVDLCPYQSSALAVDNERQYKASTIEEVTGVYCPRGTKKILFYCENWGTDESICILDNIRIRDDSCRQVYTEPKLTIKEQYYAWRVEGATNLRVFLGQMDQVEMDRVLSKLSDEEIKAILLDVYPEF